jgi:DNA-binding CsgD family transcriptional regulator
MDSFERIQRLRDAYESALDEAERLRDDYHREIVKLHRSGMSLREIAEGLGLSHQRVHQIVSPHEEKPRSKARRAAAGGAVAALALVVGTVVFLSRGDPPAPVVSMAPPSPPAATCSLTGGPRGSTFTTISLAQACAEQLTRLGAIAVVDPQTGDVIAITGAPGSRRNLRDLVVRDDCGEPVCFWGVWWAGQDSNPRHEG